MFPENFLWGCASSSYQVEGGAAQDGRGESIWDVFSHQPGNIKDNHNGDVSVDQYNRYPEDVAIMKNMGLNAYRFSLSWSRLLPTGRGEINQAGVDYYNRLIDSLLEADIEPWITLFHWDLPQALQEDFGGWESKVVVDYFADYARLVAEKYSDRVKNYFTLNEFFCFTDKSYGTCEFAPGIKLDRKGLNQVRHNSLLAHGKSVKALREAAVSEINVGLADNPRIFVPAIETQEYIDAAQKAMRIQNAPFMTTILEGAYPQEYLEQQGADSPEFTDEEMNIISEKIDFVGINAYYPMYVRPADNKLGYEIIDAPKEYPTMGADWIKFGPQIIYWAVRHVNEIWDVDNIYISENGCAATDEINENREILDVDRIAYLREHLNSALRVIEEGYPLNGYFLWSYIDNFEWADGYNYRFGIVYVDYKTLERIPKLSAEFYKNVITANALV